MSIPPSPFRDTFPRNVSRFCISACCAIRRKTHTRQCILKVMSKSPSRASPFASLGSFNAGDMPNRLHYRCLSHNVLLTACTNRIFSIHRVRIAPRSLDDVTVAIAIADRVCDSNPFHVSSRISNTNHVPVINKSSESQRNRANSSSRRTEFIIFSMIIGKY